MRVRSGWVVLVLGLLVGCPEGRQEASVAGDRASLEDAAGEEAPCDPMAAFRPPGCCPPGQKWSEYRGRCRGWLDCPEGTIAQANAYETFTRCAPLTCPLGMVKALADQPCCWPGQTPYLGECFGPASCPIGTVGEDGGCVPAATWVRIPGGDVVLPVLAGEGPLEVEEVRVEPFEVTRHPVTAWHYARCIEAGACLRSPMAGGLTDSGRGPLGHPTRLNRPMTRVSLRMAETFCGWLGGRLPTLDEWRYAAYDGAPEDPRRMWEDGARDERSCDELLDDLRTWPVCGEPYPPTPRGLCGLWDCGREFVGDGFISRFAIGVQRPTHHRIANPTSPIVAIFRCVRSVESAEPPPTAE